jgi:hypothetical protein
MSRAKISLSNENSAVISAVISVRVPRTWVTWLKHMETYELKQGQLVRRAIHQYLSKRLKKRFKDDVPF